MFVVGIRDNYYALLKMLCSCIPRLVCIVHKGRYSQFLFVLNHARCSRLLLLVVYSRCHVMSCLPGLVGCNYIFSSLMMNAINLPLIDRIFILEFSFLLCGYGMVGMLYMLSSTVNQCGFFCCMHGI